MTIISFQSMKPFWTISQMSTLDGSPKLERQVRSTVNIMAVIMTILFRQVQKFSLQASQKTAGMKASGYFHLSRNMVTRVFGLVSVAIFILVKFDKIERIYLMGGKLM